MENFELYTLISNTMIDLALAVINEDDPRKRISLIIRARREMLEKLTLSNQKIKHKIYYSDTDTIITDKPSTQ